MARPPIYLDYNATTKTREAVVQAMYPLLSEFYANPDSTHDAGMQAAYQLEKARVELAKGLGCKSEEIFFTGCGTEANNIGLHGLVNLLAADKREVLCTGVEHPSVLRPLEHLASQGIIRLGFLHPTSNGQLTLEQVEDALSEKTGLLAIMLANNETGALHPVKEIADLAASKGILVHCDAIQAFGRVAFSFEELGVDTLVLSAHKLGGPKGVGALVVKEKVKIATLLFGGGQERGMRPGTVNTPGIVGFSCAAKIALEELAAGKNQEIARLRDLFYQRIYEQHPEVKMNGTLEQALPNTLNLFFPGHLATDFVRNLSDHGIACSAGSACSANKSPQSSSLYYSHVLLSMGLSKEHAACSLRFSLGFDTTETEIESAAQTINLLLDKMPPQTLRFD